MDKVYTEENRKFILDTLLPYKENPETCGFDPRSQTCMYLDIHTGNKCAVGKWLKEGEWQKHKGTVISLDSQYGLKKILLPEALKQDLELKLWKTMQCYHDEVSTSFCRTIANNHVSVLESITGLEFPELKYEVKIL